MSALITKLIIREAIWDNVPVGFPAVTSKYLVVNVLLSHAEYP